MAGTSITARRSISAVSPSVWAWTRPAPSIMPMMPPWIRWSASCRRSKSPAVSAVAARSSSRPSRRTTRRLRAASTCCTGRPIPKPIWFHSQRIRTEVGSNRFYGGLLYRKSAQMHMGQFGAGLATAAKRNGARIFENAAVTGLKRLSGAAPRSHDQPRVNRRRSGAGGDRRQHARAVLLLSPPGDPDRQLHHRHRAAHGCPDSIPSCRRGARRPPR